MASEDYLIQVLGNRNWDLPNPNLLPMKEKINSVLIEAIPYPTLLHSLPLLHWRTVLILNGRSSVVIDNQRDSGDPPAFSLRAKWRQYSESLATRSSLYLEISTGSALDVGAFIKLLVDNDLDIFMYNSNGSGCQTWVRSCIKMLIKKGNVDSKSIKRFDQCVSSAASTGLYWVPDEAGASVGNC